MWALVRRLGEWGRRAGSGAPPQAVPARLGDHALGDQLRVMAADLLAAPDVATVAAQALADVSAHPDAAGRDASAGVRGSRSRACR